MAVASLDLRKFPKASLVFVGFVFLHSLMYFDYIGINPTYYGWISNILSLALIASLFVIKGPLRTPSSPWLLLFLMVPMLSFLPCWIENGQSPLVSARAYLSSFLPLVFFILLRSGAKEKDLVKMLTLFAVVRTLINIIQQFTYPDYLFTFRPEGLDATGYFKGIEVRSGIYRYCIEDTFLSMFLVFYYFGRLLKRIDLSDVFFFFFGLFGVYLDQTRQLMLSTLIALVLVPLLSLRGKRRLILFVIMSLVILLAAINAAVLFEDLILMTTRDLDYDNIRILSYTTYLLEFWGGPLSVIFGNGPVGDSAYGQQIAYMYENLKLFHSDVGIVGALNLYGIVTVLVYFAFIVFFVFRNWKKFRIHIKMYFVAQFINMPMICIFTQRVNCMIFLAFMLFLCDKDIRRCNYLRKMRKKPETVYAGS